MDKFNKMVGTKWNDASSYKISPTTLLCEMDFWASGWTDINDNKHNPPPKHCLRFFKNYTDTFVACDGFAHKGLEMIFGKGSLLYEDGGWGGFGNIIDDIRLGDAISYKNTTTPGHIEVITTIESEKYSVVGGNVHVNGGDGQVYKSIRKKGFYEGFLTKNNYCSCTHIPIDLGE